jgi:transposase
MAKKRRTYTPEFKTEAVKLVTEQGYSIAEAARSLGIHETLLRSWKQALEAQGARPAPATASSLPSRKRCAACVPRTNACERSAIS